MEGEFPDSFYCCITYQIMQDPVMDPDGSTYERSAILKWLKNSKTSPISRKYLTEDMLIPNRALRDIIMSTPGIKEEFRKINTVHEGIEEKKEKQVEYKLPNASFGSDWIALTSQPNPSRIGTEFITIHSKSIPRIYPVRIAIVLDLSESTRNVIENVREALQCLTNKLTENDMLSLIGYSDVSSVEMKMRHMDIEGKEEAIKVIKSLKTGGSRNTWDGIKAGLEQFNQKKATNDSLFLYCFGNPNINPPRGEHIALRNYLLENPQLDSVIINTFGFNCSKILSSISSMGGGVFTYIPTRNSITRMLINNLTTVRLASGVKVRLNIRTASANIRPFLKYNIKITEWGYIIDLGLIQQGLDRNLIIINPRKEEYQLTLEYWNLDKKVYINNSMPDVFNFEKWIKCYSRETLVNKILDFGEDVVQNREILSDTRNIKGFYLRNLEKRITKSVRSKKDYNKWGKHYLASIVNVHKNQICVDTKEIGSNEYIHDLWLEYRDLPI